MGAISLIIPNSKQDFVSVLTEAGLFACKNKTEAVTNKQRTFVIKYHFLRVNLESEHLRVLTRKNHRQIKFQRLRKV